MMRILLADDDNSMRRVLEFKLRKRGFEVTTASNGKQAVKSLEREPFDLLLSDIRMPEVDGIALLEHAKSLRPDLKVILITAYATVSQAVEAVKLGAFDYITKPFEDDELFVAIDKALRFGDLERENKRLRNRLRGVESDDKLIGASAPFKEMMAIIKRIADTDATVLLTGESGTGKELAARTIHRLSARASGEFVAVNCAAIPRDLLESELFGHVKGAFTGAVRDKRGKFEIAQGGTLLLDEVADLAMELQAKLLRVLQDHVVEPIGAEKAREIDVRLIASTNASLEDKVRSGSFREDLYYRLNVVPIRVPSLRERKEDIPLLAEEFMRKVAKGGDISIAPELRRALIEYRWPGNIRELQNLMERMVLLRSSDLLTLDSLPDDFGVFDPRAGSSRERTESHLTYRDAEQQLILKALERCGWNKSKAAKYLQIPRHVLLYRIKKYGLEEGRRPGP